MTVLTDFCRSTRLPGVTDQTAKVGALWYNLWKNRGPVGGANVEWRIRYRPHARTMGWGEFAESKVQKRDVITTPTLPTVGLAEPVDISKKRLANILKSTDSQNTLVNYMNEMSQAAEDSLLDHLAGSVFTGGETVANKDGQDLYNLTGLKSIVSSSSTYGGVAVADSPYWVSNVIGSTTCADNAAATMTAGTYLGITIAGTETVANVLTTSHNAYIGKLMTTAIRNCTWKSDAPDLIVTNIDGYALIEQAIIPTLRNQQPIGYGNFKGLMWDGAIPVVVDRQCPLRTVFVLNTKYLELRAQPGSEITFEAFEKRTGSDVLTGMWMFEGQMICTSRRHQGGIFNLPTA
jgi:hypothetical protein